MELLYHVNEEDNVLGSIERDRAHETEALHRSGMVFLLDNRGNVLIQHRSPLKKTFPDCYDASSTFHFAFGETYDDGTSRELFEETGVRPKINFVGKFIHHDPPEHQIVVVYYAKTDMPIKVDPNETPEAWFLPKSEVDRIVQEERITPWFRDGWKMFSKYAVDNNIFGKRKRVTRGGT